MLNRFLILNVQWISISMPHLYVACHSDWFPPSQDPAIVRAHTSSCGLMGIRIVIFGMWLQPWMRVMVDVGEWMRLSLEW